MKRDHRPPSVRSGFTLLELLTVIVIIGVLAAILTPVLGRTKDRAQELAAKELCNQVAVAWTQLMLDKGRLPSSTLITTWCSEQTDSSEGDLVIPMDPGAMSVLNWWTPETPVPEGDARKFKPKTITGTPLLAGSFSNPDYTLVEFWPIDVHFERSFIQKCVGLYPPWAEWRFKNVVDASLSSSDQEGGETAPTDSVATLKREWAPWRVRVLLDTNGDGRLVLPDEIAALSNVGLDTNGKATLRGTAVAWTRSKDGKRLITSW